jgi:hypothetical protein
LPALSENLAAALFAFISSVILARNFTANISAFSFGLIVGLMPV